MLCVSLIIISGCSSNYSTEDNNNLLENQEKGEIKDSANQQSKDAWDYVDEGFEKLKNSKFSYEGVESEIAHISDKEGELDAVFGQTYYKGDVDIYGKDMKIQYGMTDLNNVDENTISFISRDDIIISKEAFKVNYTDNISSYKIKDNKIMSEDGQINEDLETFVNISEGSTERYNMVYKIDTLTSKGDWDDFMTRGKTAIRLIPNSYFSGEVNEKDGETEIVFSFSPQSKGYDTFLKSNIYEMMYDAYCPIDTLDENNEIAFKDELKEAKIIYRFDKDGYPVSYERYSEMYYENFNQTIPYVVYYTFNKA